LEALVEAGAWLLRITDDFKHSVIVLRAARNVKYGTFMEPGRQMNIRVELVEQDAYSASFKGKGEMDGQTTVVARLTVARYNLRDRDPAFAPVDERLVQHLRNLHDVLRLNTVPAPFVGGS
jgi:3-hydroxyacyl-[acyl-carrier-protein] dehydratase